MDLPESESQKSQVPYRQIRANYNDDTITLYQAYSPAIALPAVRQQKLNASPRFSSTRMTWIKPSWTWMMYRSGYSLKDANQSRILALKISHEHFQELLSHAAVTHGNPNGGGLSEEEKKMPVRVQWDPERSPRLGVLPYRSIQIGIKGDSEVGRKFVNEWIKEIEDLTEKALDMKRALDEEGELGTEEMVERGLMLVEKEYAVPEELRQKLRMEWKDGFVIC